MVESVSTAVARSSIKPSSGPVTQTQRQEPLTDGLSVCERNRPGLVGQSEHRPWLLSVKQQGLLDWTRDRWKLQPRYVEEAELRALGLSLHECDEDNNASLYSLVEVLWSLSREARVVRSLVSSA